MPLYRALRQIEVERGNILIPKGVASFVAHPRLSITLPFTLGERVEHAIREHQWDSKYPTRGISCTTSWEVALRYARSKVIVRIDEAACDSNLIKRYIVKEHLPENMIAHPQDDEVILVADCEGPLPAEIVAEVFYTDS